MFVVVDVAAWFFVWLVFGSFFFPPISTGARYELFRTKSAKRSLYVSVFIYTKDTCDKSNNIYLAIGPRMRGRRMLLHVTMD